MSTEERNGNCFEVALKLTLDRGTTDAIIEVARFRLKNGSDLPVREATDFRIKLVHGLVSRPTDGLRHCHAWVEIGRYYVADLANRNAVMIPRERYYMLGEIREEDLVRYTPAEVREQMRKHQTYGPWEERLLLSDEGYDRG